MAEEASASPEEIQSAAKKSSTTIFLTAVVVGDNGKRKKRKNLIYSSLAQSVEHSAVNRVVVGSSPTGGAKIKDTPKGVSFILPS